MQLKTLVFMLSVAFFEATTARRCLPIPPSQPMIVVQEDIPCCSEKPRCFEELVLPPIRAELPRGLGYFPSAVPLVTSYFNPAAEVGGVCCGASVPVTSPCSCLTLAAPFSPDLSPLVRPVIL